MTPQQSRAIDAYVRYFEGLSPDTVADLRGLAVPDMVFRDPFNDVQGVDKAIAVLAAAFEDARDVRFEVLDRAVSGNTCYLRWRFHFRPNRLRAPAPWTINGISEVVLAPDGRIVSHIDHWDAAGQFFARLPLIGPLLRWLASRLRVE